MSTFTERRVRPATPSHDDLIALVSAVVVEGDCPWCALGFDPCVCEMSWLVSPDAALAHFSED